MKTIEAQADRYEVDAGRLCIITHYEECGDRPET